MRWVALLALLATTAFADTASRLYDQGKYPEAMERYKKAAERQPENWPLLYNLGAAAYKAGKPDEAAKAFERAIGAKDKELQQRSFYNLGNSYYRIGEAAEKQAPPQALAFYEKSLKGFEGALALDPKDTDAKFNADVTKKKIEELKKQQEQQQKQDNKDKQDKNQDKNQKKDDQQQQQSEKSQEQEKKEKQKQDQQPQQADKQKQQEQQQQKQQAQAQAAQTNNFEKIQAAALLDNLREDEKNWNFFPELQMDLKNSTEPDKDW